MSLPSMKVQPSIKGMDQRSRVNRHGAKTSLRAWIPAVLLLLTGLVGLGTASLLRGGVPDWYLVMTPPGSTLADTVNIVIAADGRLVQAGRFPNIVIAGSPRPDFPSALRRAGAWLAIPAPQVAGCLAPTSSQEQKR